MPAPLPSPVRSRRALRACAFALLAATAACGRSGGGGGEVVFALAGPMQQGYGQSTRRGADLAVREINASGGINRRSVRLLVKDDQASTDRAIAIARELVDDPAVVALAGHVNSGTTIAAAGTYDGALPALATTATSPEVSRLGDWVYRVASSDSSNAVALAEVARGISPAVAVLYSNDDYGRGLAASFRAALLEGGGTVPEADPYLDDTEDFTPYLRRMQQRGVQMVFVAGLDAAAARIITQARQVGLAARFIGGDGLEPLKAQGPGYEGTLVGLLYHRDASDRARRFAEAYRQAYDAEADPFAAAAYDAVQLLAAAARAGGADRAAIQRYLRGVGREGGTPAFEGATGTIRFDQNGDPVNKTFAVGIIRSGTIQLARGAR
ncbi:MAG TPA: ABC transporter substrate-binding protein [Longimicrobiaceae bacterium]|nr:ABC transporter substrate-binding protein [Longimicrobiaceae bacterium]